MPNKFENPINQQEIWRNKIVIKDIADFSGISIDELGEQTYQSISKKIQNNPKRENSYREKFKFSENDNFDDSLRELIRTTTENFRNDLERKKEKYKQQINHCISVAIKRGYLQSEPEPQTIIMSHKLLHEGAPSMPENINLNTHEQDNNTIIIDVNLSSTVLAHEFGHALSVNKQDKRSGLMALVEKENGQGTKTKGNQWLNEGLTIIWEQMTTLDDKPLPGRDEKGDLYNWYLEATKLILTEVNLSSDDALKAYFGDKKMLSLLKNKIQQKYNCSLEDLKKLSYKLDINWTKEVITGQPVMVTLKKTTQHTVREQLLALSKIFPNLSINEEN